MLVNHYWVRVGGRVYFVRFESHAPLKWFTHVDYRRAYCFASSQDAARVAGQLIQYGYSAEVVTLRQAPRRRSRPPRRPMPPPPVPPAAAYPQPPEHLRPWVEKIVQAGRASGSQPPEALRAGYRTLARQHHPDHGGLTADMQAVNEAFAWLRLNGGWSGLDFDAAFDVPF